MFRKGFLLLHTLFLINCVCKNVSCQEVACPPPLSLWPYCTCRITPTEQTVIDCSGAKTQDEIETAFTNTTFPNKNIDYLFIQYNKDLKYLTRNVFGDVYFNRINILNTVLEYIDQSVFVGSFLSVTEVIIEHSNLVPEGFFFNSLDQYQALLSLQFDAAGTFNVVPYIVSKSLKILALRNCSVKYLPKQVLAGMTNLEYLDLSINSLTSESLPSDLFSENRWMWTVIMDYNKISVIQTGTFKNMIALKFVSFYSNKITHIESGAFNNLRLLWYLNLARNELTYLANGSLALLPKLELLRISYNSIEFIDSDVFSSFNSLTFLDADFNHLSFIAAGTFDVMKSGELRMIRNQLTTLEEEWLSPVLKNGIDINLYNNPLECGCDLSWLYNDTSLMNSLSAECENGTNVRDLDPSYFTINC